MTRVKTAAASRSTAWILAAVLATAGALVLAVLLADRAGAQDSSDAAAESEPAAEPESDGAADSGDDQCDGRHRKGGRHGEGGRHLDRSGQRAGHMAELIGIETDQLREALRSGQSLAEVASGNGVDPQTLIDAIVESIEEHVDARLAEGLIDSERADEIRSGAPARAEKIVNATRPADHGEHKERRGDHRRSGPSAEGIGQALATMRA